MSAHTSLPTAPIAVQQGARGVDVALRDGSTLHVRPLSDHDRPAVRAFLEGLSLDSIGFRFFGRIDLEWATDWAMDMDRADRYALVATTGPDQTIVAHAAYIRTGEDRAEVAFAVADQWQGHGIATIMLAHLAAAAQEHAIAVFIAEVLPGNHRMVGVFRDSGFPVTLRAGDGVIEVELPTSRSQLTRECFEQREQIAAVAALRRILTPRSVAVIGASPKRGTVGGEILRNLRSYGFDGAVYAINRRVAKIGGQRAYRSIADVPEPVDLAVIAVPAEQVCKVARECAAAGAHALLVISAGFSEVGEEGAARQRELLAICRQAGMRMVGPNCLGVLNTASDVRLDATFAGRSPLPGRVGFLSQSGGLGIAILEAAGRLGLGLSAFVSVGNKADISGNDLLEYWEHDPGTDVILLYLESFGNPRRFARIARRVGRAKPIAAVKSGRSPAGARASASHTGALLAASDVTVDALFCQSGVIRTDTMHELFDVGALLAAQPVPGGLRVAIVTNAGGPGILCADACQAAGLDVVELGEQVRARLSSFLAPEASLGNPIDMIATASVDSYRYTIETLVQERACDSIIAIFVPSLVTDVGDVAREIRAAAAGCEGVALVSVFMNSDGPPPERAGEAHVPNFEFPEDAAHALAHAAAYGRWRSEPVGEVPQLSGCRPDEAAAILAEALAAGGGWLGPLKVSALLDCYGLAPIQTRAEPGVELLMGVVHDESFGPVIACGAGGTSAEVLGDVAVRLTPLTDLDAHEMLHSLRTYQLLDGYRGAPACDVAALEEMLLRLSALVEAHPEISELDANPVIAGPATAAIVDARIRVAPATPPAPLASL